MMAVMEAVKANTSELSPEEQKLLSMNFFDISGQAHQDNYWTGNFEANASSGGNRLHHAFRILDRESAKAPVFEKPNQNKINSERSQLSRFSFFHSSQSNANQNSQNKPSKKEIVEWVKSTLKKF